VWQYIGGMFMSGTVNKKKGTIQTGNNDALADVMNKYGSRSQTENNDSLSHIMNKFGQYPVSFGKSNGARMPTLDIQLAGCNDNLSDIMDKIKNLDKSSVNLKR
jgi:hypothetical protein